MFQASPCSLASHYLTAMCDTTKTQEQVSQSVNSDSVLTCLSCFADNGFLCDSKCLMSRLFVCSAPWNKGKISGRQVLYRSGKALDLTHSHYKCQLLFIYINIYMYIYILCIYMYFMLKFYVEIYLC